MGRDSGYLSRSYLNNTFDQLQQAIHIQTVNMTENTNPGNFANR